MSDYSSKSDILIYLKNLYDSIKPTDYNIWDINTMILICCYIDASGQYFYPKLKPGWPRFRETLRKTKYKDIFTKVSVPYLHSNKRSLLNILEIENVDRFLGITRILDINEIDIDIDLFVKNKNLDKKIAESYTIGKIFWRNIRSALIHQVHIKKTLQDLFNKKTPYYVIYEDNDGNEKYMLALSIKFLCETFESILEFIYC